MTPVKVKFGRRRAKRLRFNPELEESKSSSSEDDLMVQKLGHFEKYLASANLKNQSVFASRGSYDKNGSESEHSGKIVCKKTRKSPRKLKR